MILQSLVNLYEVLADKGKVDKPGWSKVPVSYGLNIDENGQLVSVIPLKKLSSDNKKELPQNLSLPMPVKRASNVAANFLWDTSSYFFENDNKGKPDRTKKCFEAAKALHNHILCNTDTAAANAIKAFFDNLNTENIIEELESVGCSEKTTADIIKKGANLLFMPLGKSAADYKEICDAWQDYYNCKVNEGGNESICLVTGKRLPAAVLHPSIKGVKDSQQIGASLVSFNAQSFESFEKHQGLNSPVSEYAAFAYTTALNYLLSEENYVNIMGDTTVVCWTEDDNEGCQDIMTKMFGRREDEISQSDLWSTIKKLSRGQTVDWNNVSINPDNRFYILGLSPNVARLSVRFFLCNTFGEFMKNAVLHDEQMSIITPSWDTRKHLSVKSMLSETVNPNSKNKSAKPQLAGDVIYSILTGQRYPATLYNGVMLRIKADREINRCRAAIIKAFLLRNYSEPIPKEALGMKLNEDCDVQAYVLGELFSLLEEIQSEANPGINTTIKDKYFTSASSTPAVIFPLLIDLAQKHLRKIKDGGIKVYYQKQFTELVSKIKEDLPTRMTMQEKGIFQIGYYHRTQKRFTKKEDK